MSTLFVNLKITSSGKWRNDSFCRLDDWFVYFASFGFCDWRQALVSLSGTNCDLCVGDICVSVQEGILCFVVVESLVLVCTKDAICRILFLDHVWFIYL